MSRQNVSRANQRFFGRATYSPYQQDRPGIEGHETYRWRPTGNLTVTFTAGIAAGATTGTLTGNFTGPSGLWPITFSDGETLNGKFTNGSTAVTFYPGSFPITGGTYGVPTGPVNAVTATATVAGIPPQLAVANAYAASQSIGAGLTANLNGGAPYVVGGVGIPDVPRNVVGAWTTSSTVTVTGTDYYGQPQTESQTGTAFTGKKAFASITSILSSASITVATFGTGSALGLPFNIQSGDFLGAFLNDAADPGTLTIADITSPATSTTGDVRGTYTTNGALNGAKFLQAELKVRDDSTQFGSFGVTPA